MRTATVLLALALAACDNATGPTATDAGSGDTTVGDAAADASDAGPQDSTIVDSAPDTVPSDTVPSDTATSDTAANDTATSDTAPKDTTGDASPADAPSADVVADVPPSPDVSADAGGKPIQCTGTPTYFPTFSKACQADADCFVAAHQINCCGTQIAFGYAKSEEAAFTAAEKVCAGQYPGCGCAQFPTLAEDGYTAMNGNQDLGVKCSAGQCQSFVKSAKLDCKDENQGFPKPWKWCQTTADCSYVLHVVDCCGSQAALGITKGAKDAYEQAEATCAPGKAICDCAPKPVSTEDGGTAGEGLIAVQCEAGSCLTYIK